MFCSDNLITLPVHKNSIPNSMSVEEYFLNKVVQNIVIDNQVYVDLSNGSAPLGIVRHIEKNMYDEMKAEVVFKRMFMETYSFDRQERYPVNANLYVSDGLFTTKAKSVNHPCVGMVISPPHPVSQFLKMMWY